MGVPAEFRKAPTQLCPGCKVALPAQLGATHPYLGASPSCWAIYNEVLAREFSSPALMRVHRLTVDAYAVQHPGVAERRTIQSGWVHLAGLYLTVERGLSHDFARRVIGALTQEASQLAWLEPPDRPGTITAIDVARASASDHENMVRDWARTAWAAWRPHHVTIAAVADRVAVRL